MGQHTGTLTLFSNDPNNPEHVVTVTGTFGWQLPASKSAPRRSISAWRQDGGQATATIANSGTEELKVTGLGLDGEFEFVGEVVSLPAVVPPGASIALHIASSAQSHRRGPRSPPCRLGRPFSAPCGGPCQRVPAGRWRDSGELGISRSRQHRRYRRRQVVVTGLSSQPHRRGDDVRSGIPAGNHATRRVI